MQSDGTPWRRRSRPRGDAFARLALTMARHRRRVLACWLVAAAAGLIGLPHLLDTLAAPSVAVAGSESEQASEILGNSLPTLGDEQVIAVFHSPAHRTTDPEFRSALAAGRRALARERSVSGVVQLPMAGDPAPATVLPEAMEPLRALTRDDHIAYVLVGVTGDERQRQRQAPVLQTVVDEATRAASAGTVQGYLVGVSAFSNAVQQAQIRDATRIELVAVPVAMLVLLIGLWAPVAALVPMLVAGASIATTLGLFALLADTLSVDGTVLIAVDAVGLGIGIDYAMFVMNRYRENLAGGATPEQALSRAAATTGRTVVYSGLLLLLAVTTLFVVRWDVFTQLTIGTIAVIAVTSTASVTLLPALLAAATEWLEWRPRWMARWTPFTARDRGGLVRWTDHVTRHPLPYAIGITAGLLLLAAPVQTLRLGVDLEQQALAGTPFLTGRTISDTDIPGLSGMVTIVLPRGPVDGAPAPGPVLAALRADPEVAAAAVLDNRADLTAFVVVPEHPLDSPLTARLVERIRVEILPTTTPPGTTALVGGSSALVADVLAEIAHKQWWVIGMALAVMFVVLTITLRSVLLPVKAMVMTLLATGAAFGLIALLFQGGAGGGAAGSGLIWPQVPLVLCAILFGLTTDYELFLVRRIQEEYLVTGDNRRSIAVGLQSTARPISLAAVIIAVAFGSLVLSSFGSVRAAGFAGAFALIIDATLIRLILVPALMQLFGRWNWWFPTWPRSAPIRRRRRPPSKGGDAVRHNDDSELTEVR
ncbi:MMPL family transporter [Nocardia suismassiliense]|uniref:MMPL family transporter n=1 Tax=Nocardia suismassiliense TaxID=2077092 RepID=A0ABW6R2X7_9NOCA